ncbi:YebG family protein [Corallincola platygyrae]|uniref:YebG family protein n=1 Tax=Corallincola platygyrae TaxID=1193278 RepID=A0ABW4XLP2_9GAMM
MAVVVKYVVVRDGEEKMTFTSKKEADAYDRLLDIADAVSDYLVSSELELAEEQAEVIGHHLAMNREVMVQLLKTGKMPTKTSESKD